MSEFIEITASVEQDRKGSLAIWTGDLDEYGGKVWIFLPKSKIKYSLRGNRATISLPVWLAEDRGLTKNVTRRLDDIETRLARIEKRLGLDKPMH